MLNSGLQSFLRIVVLPNTGIVFNPMNMIKKVSFVLIMLCFWEAGYGKVIDKRFGGREGIVPQPVSADIQDGQFVFNKHTVIVVENTEQEETARRFAGLFTASAGFTPKVKAGGGKGDIIFATNPALKNEGYILNITNSLIRVEASGNKGFFYATQTLRQLLPPSIEQKRVAGTTRWNVPAMNITDEPRFDYRGLMLDVSRCFIPKETVLKIIDCMGLLKVNKLHLHLVDDNGWRLEIKKYPELTGIGAWRVDRTDVLFPERRNARKGEPTPVGGFYTQEDMKEIIAYAATREVEVIPEIEMPAHTASSLAAYPELVCPVMKEYIGVVPGMGGGLQAVYCAGNDSVFSFLEGVIDEVAALFPSKYIHLGGDEASKTNWKECPLCQERMHKENIPDEEELQSYFMKRISRYVQGKGKEVMGWDELTNSEIPEGAVIYGWRGTGSAALKAARQGHRFVMTPARVLYLIRYQGPQWFEPVTYFGNNTLKDIYEYEPVQQDWTPEVSSLLMGVQASLWTEFCNTPEDAEYLIFPRLAALAEIAWIRPGTKNWNSFVKRLDTYNEHLGKLNINYARSMFNIDHAVMSAGGTLKAVLTCIRPDVDIRYTTDGTEPQAASLLYGDTLTMAQGILIKAATFRNGEQVGKTLTLDLDWNKATTCSVKSDKPQAGVLTNGLRGSTKHTDFEWCGWYDTDFSFTVDLLETKPFNSVTLGCLTNSGMAIHFPAEIKVSVSDDNFTFSPVGILKFTLEEIFGKGTYKEDKTIQIPNGATGRYVRIEVVNPGICPATHVRAGTPVWVYMDEVEIK